MHEGGALTWREVVEKHHSALVDELSVRLDSDLREAVSRAVAAERSQAAVRLRLECDEARRSQVESLNQVLRRLRDCRRGACSRTCWPKAALPMRKKWWCWCLKATRHVAPPVHGVDAHALPMFSTDSAPAIVAAIDSRDPVVALATEAEISPVLASAFGRRTRTAKAYLFPVVARHSVVAMLIASGVASSASDGLTARSAPIELLCEAAGMRLEAAGYPAAILARQPTAADLVQLAPGAPVVRTVPRAWNDLTAEDQKLHLQAQRMARVRVAEMRLYHESELRSGTSASDIYGALQNRD